MSQTVQPEMGTPRDGFCPCCGQEFHRLDWDRPYLCGACGRPLAPRRTGPRTRLAAYLGGAAIAALAAVGGMRLLTERAAAAPRPAAIQPERPVLKVVRPPRFRENLLRKARWLEEDLDRLPVSDSAFRALEVSLRARLAETYGALAALEWDRNRNRADGLRDRALGYARSLRPLDRDLSVRLELELAEPGRLRWVQPRPVEDGSSVLGADRLDQPVASSIGSLGSGRGSSSAPLNPNVRFDTGLSRIPSRAEPGPPGFRGAPPPSSGPAALPAAPGPSPSPAGNMPGSGTGPGSATSPFPLMPPEPIGGRNGPLSTPTILTPGPVITPGLSTRIRRLRGVLEENPDDLRAADELGAALEERAHWTQGGLRGPRKEKPEGQAREDLLEARAVYLRAAERAALRVHRGTFYLAASQVESLLREHEAAYRHAQAAARETPYSDRVWKVLYAACQRAGRWEEAVLARRSLREWSFPGLRRI